MDLAVNIISLFLFAAVLFMKLHFAKFGKFTSTYIIKAKQTQAV